MSDEKTLQVGGSRGQVYTLEAVLAMLVLTSVIVFVIPSSTISLGTDEAESIEEERLILQDANELVASHVDSGQLKSDMLNYNNREEEWQGGPSGFSNQYILTNPDSPFGDAIQAFETRHNVTVSVYLTPSPDSSTGDSGENRTLFIKGGSTDRTIGTVTTVITLYDNDRLRSPAEAHTRRATGYIQNSGDGGKLSSSNASNYPIDEADTSLTSGDETVYNTVQVQFIVGENTN